MMRSTRIALCIAALCVLAAGISTAAQSATQQHSLKFEISFPGTAHAGPITGRVFVYLTQKENPEPRLQDGSWGDTPPFFGADVSQLQPGQAAVVDEKTLGYPVSSLREVPAGDYFVQALLNVYTEFHRSDGHTIWAHMDQWEGQHLNRSPGNLYSKVQKVHLDSSAGYEVRLNLTETIAPIEPPADTEWVKHIKIQSQLLTRFWGHPIYIGAIVLLPRGYDEHTNSRYPVVYDQGHFNLAPPFGFSPQDSPVPDAQRAQFAELNRENGHEFFRAWTSDNFPRMISVTFQHPTPYFDDSYAVNSANNGPYGDALLTEMIPYLEQHFRMIPKPYARVLTGGSTGGWESLALQVLYPDFFGGTWTLYPDPIDFRRYQLTNAYDDDNAFSEPGHTWLDSPRYVNRKSDGQPEVTMQRMSQLEDVLGSHGRSCQQLEIWEAVYGPVGDDGYPKPLWDKRTGKIDHAVALYMRDHGYDLSYTIRTKWPELGPKLRDKLHIYVGDMDNFYLNLAVYLLEDFLKTAKGPTFAGEFGYGRPMKGHGWQPASQHEMIRQMAEFIRAHSPAGENAAQWNY
jgi:hypothetical protein